MTEPNAHRIDPRDALAEDRTVLAAERTFAAWLRTGLAFLVGGLATQRYLHEVPPILPSSLIALVLLTCSAVCFLAAGWRDWRVRQRLAPADLRLLPPALTIGAASLLSAISIAASISMLAR
jgi:putative membrane protein